MAVCATPRCLMWCTFKRLMGPTSRRVSELNPPTTRSPRGGHGGDRPASVSGFLPARLSGLHIGAQNGLCPHCQLGAARRLRSLPSLSPPRQTREEVPRENGGIESLPRLDVSFVLLRDNCLESSDLIAPLALDGIGTLPKCVKS